MPCFSLENHVPLAVLRAFKSTSKYVDDLHDKDKMNRDMTNQQNERAPSEDTDQPGHLNQSLRFPHEESLGP